MIEVKRGRHIRAIKPDGEVVFISDATARNSKFLQKYNIRIDDEEYLNPSKPQSIVFEEAPKRRPIARRRTEEVIESQSADSIVEQSPNIDLEPSEIQ